MQRTVAPLLAALDGPGFREAQRAFVATALFVPTDDPSRRARLLDQLPAAPQHVMASAFRNMLACDTAEAAARCRVPFLYLYYLYTAKPSSSLARLRQICPQMVTGQTVGAGHFHQLEVPDQVNAMIDRFLAITFREPVRRS